MFVFLQADPRVDQHVDDVQREDGNHEQVREGGDQGHDQRRVEAAQGPEKEATHPFHSEEHFKGNDLLPESNQHQAKAGEYGRECRAQHVMALNHAVAEPLGPRHLYRVIGRVDPEVAAPEKDSLKQPTNENGQEREG